MDIATYIANYQTTPVSAELGTARLQLVMLIDKILGEKSSFPLINETPLDLKIAISPE